MGFASLIASALSLGHCDRLGQTREVLGCTCPDQSPSFEAWVIRVAEHRVHDQREAAGTTQLGRAQVPRGVHPSQRRADAYTRAARR